MSEKVTIENSKKKEKGKSHVRNDFVTSHFLRTQMYIYVHVYLVLVNE